MALISFQQTDTAADNGFTVGGSGLTAGSTTISREMTEGGTAGSSEFTVDPGVNQAERACISFQTDANEPSGAFWSSGGSWTVRLNVTTSNMDMQWRGTYIYARSSGGTFTLLGSLTAQTTSLGSTGTATHTVNGRRNWKRTSGDTIVIVIGLYYNNTHGGTTIGITPSVAVDSGIEDTPQIVCEGLETSAASISVTASTNRFTRSTGSWTKTPEVGQKFVSAGFSNSANNGIWTVAAATSTTIDVSETGILVDEATGTGQTLGGHFSSLWSALVDAGTFRWFEVHGTWTADDDRTTTAALGGTPRCVYVDPIARHSGVAHNGTGSWHRARRVTSGGDMMSSSSSSIWVGVDFQNETGGWSDEFIDLAQATGGVQAVSIYDSVIGNDPDTPGANQGDLIYVQATQLDFYAENCVFYNWDRGIVSFWDNVHGASVATFNCVTAFNCGANFSSGQTGFVLCSPGGTDLVVNAFNCAIHMRTAANAPFWLNSVSSDNETVVIDRCITNASDWAEESTPGDWPTENITDSTLSATFTTSSSPGAGTFVCVTSLTTPYDATLLDSTDNDAQDVHADSSGANATMPSTDIAGTARPQNTNYDLGAFEVPFTATAGPGAYLQRMEHMPAPNPLLRR